MTKKEVILLKPGCTLHPLLTGFILYRIPNKKIPFGILPIKRIKDIVGDLVEAGARHIELVSDIIYFTPQFKNKFEKEMKHLEAFRKEGITFSVHINHIGYSFPTHYKWMRHCTINQFQSFVEYYGPLEPTHYTLHLGPDEMFHAQVFKNLPTRKAPSLKRFPPIKKVGIRTITVEEILRNMPKAFKGLNEQGPDLKKVYIENSEGMSRKEYDSLFHPISKKFTDLGCLLDVGHLLMEEYSNNEHCLEDFIDYWGKNKKKLKAVHCHDVVMSFNNKKLVAESIDELKKEGRNKDDLVMRKLEEFMRLSAKQKPVFADHQNLGTGILNLPSLLRALKDIDFQGPIIFEGGNPKGFSDSVRLLAKEIEKVKKEK